MEGSTTTSRMHMVRLFEQERFVRPGPVQRCPAARSPRPHVPPHVVRVNPVWTQNADRVAPLHLSWLSQRPLPLEIRRLRRVSWVPAG